MIYQSRSITILIAAAALVAAGLGCAANECRGGLEACAKTVDCCDGLFCSARNICEPPVGPSVCGDHRCDADESPSTCCLDCVCPTGSCNATTKACSAPSCSGKVCSSSATCCDGFTCSRFGKTCHAARNLALGDACTASSQCASGLCFGYCTKACARSTDCGTASFCLETAQGFLCIPSCQSILDCTVFGSNASCQSSTDPGGLMLKGCFAR